MIPLTNDSRIGIINTMALGDHMMGLAFVHRVRDNFPGAEITYVCQDKQEPLARCLEGKLVEGVVVLDRKNGWRGIRDANRDLKGISPTHLIDIAANDKSGMIMFRQKAEKIRPSKKDCSGGLSWRYNPKANEAPEYDLSTHRVSQILSIADFLGLDKKPISFEMHLPQQAQDLSEKVIEKYSLRDGKVIALPIGTSKEVKRWPLSNFMRLSEILVGEGYRVVFLGSRKFPSDKDYDLRMSRQYLNSFTNEENCINLTEYGNITPAQQLLRDSFLLRYTDIFSGSVHNDTGTAHIRGSIGSDAQKKSLTLFGPTNHRMFRPFDESAYNPEYDLRGGHGWVMEGSAHLLCMSDENEKYCSERKKCNHKHCMYLIDPEDVAKAVIEHTNIN